MFVGSYGEWITYQLNMHVCTYVRYKRYIGNNWVIDRYLKKILEMFYNSGIYLLTTIYHFKL